MHDGIQLLYIYKYFLNKKKEQITILNAIADKCY